jgi:hypothetical protein
MSSKSYGGAFLPNKDYRATGTWTFTKPPTFAAPVVNGAPTSTAVKTAQQAISGDLLHAGNLAWTNPETVTIIILRVILNITTASTGASTIDVGVTATSATTTSDTLLDGVSGTPAAVFDSMNAALDSGANAKAQSLVAAKWVTLDEASGDTSGMVATLTVQYVLA